jgi:hypothetical protein
MQQPVEQEPSGRNGPMQAAGPTERAHSAAGRSSGPSETRTSDVGRSANGNGAAPATSNGISGFVSEYPVLAIGAALTFGLGMALALQPRRRERFDRRAVRVARDFERKLTREVRNLGHSETAERISSGIGGVLSKVDLSALMSQGQAYLDTLRRRVR